MFTIYGPGVTDPVPLEQLFVRPAVTKTAAVPPQQAISGGDRSPHASSPESAYRSAAGKRRYQAAESPRRPSLRAAQVMSSPVTVIFSGAPIAQALALLDRSEFRHLPVLSAEHQLIGMLSDRDLLACMCGSGMPCMHCADDHAGVPVDQVMQDQVLSVSADSDARHIARLFVERRIGALPVMDNQQQLAGMITRSDILKAVMVHFDLSLWS